MAEQTLAEGSLRVEARVAVGTRSNKVGLCKDLGGYLLEDRKSLEEIRDLAYSLAGLWKPGHQ